MAPGAEILAVGRPSSGAMGDGGTFGPKESGRTGSEGPRVGQLYS